MASTTSHGNTAGVFDVMWQPPILTFKKDASIKLINNLWQQPVASTMTLTGGINHGINQWQLAATKGMGGNHRQQRGPRPPPSYT